MTMTIYKQFKSQEAKQARPTLHTERWDGGGRGGGGVQRGLENLLAYAKLLPTT